MKNLKIKSIYELNNYDYKKLWIEKSDWYDNEWTIFEWDCDYLIDRNWYRLYFLIHWNTVYTSDINTDYDDILLEFCNWQDTRISKWWFNKRLQTKNRKYFDDDDTIENLNWKFRIVYRWWAWYYYDCFKYID